MPQRHRDAEFLCASVPPWPLWYKDRNNMRTTPAIEFADVGYQRNGRSIISKLNLSMDPGETFVLLGRSGCGKTTTLKLINRLLEPTQGEVRVEGVLTTSWDPIKLRRHIGYVIQEVGLFPHLTIERNVGVVPRLEGWPEPKIRARVRELLILVGLDPDHFARRRPSELSGGQRQRVGVARALAIDPPILLMDEPFGALDPLTRSEIQQEFGQLQDKLKKTVVLVTHDLREALLLSSRIGLMKEGKIVITGTPAELLQSSDPEIVGYLRPLMELSKLTR